MERQKGKTNIIKVFIVAILLLPIFLLGLLLQSENNVHASSNNIGFDDATCVDFDGNIVPYDTNDTVYAREITLYYFIDLPKYRIIVYNSAGGEIVVTQGLSPDENGKGIYVVKANGKLTIRCQGVDENGFILENIFVDTSVRSDNLGPQEPAVSQMDDWTQHANGYTVAILIGKDNGNSDIKNTQISIIYAKDFEYRTITSPEVNDSFIIYEKCEVVITVYDNAGNVSDFSYKFEMFDSTPPTPPSFNLEPNVEIGEATNGYAKDYVGTISFGEDSESGVDESSMKYTINGELYDYDGGFVLNEQREYILTAYYSDNAKNTSEIITVTINNIDRLPPSIGTPTLSVDLTKENPYKITISCSDAQSGINRISVEGVNIVFVKGHYNFYEGDFVTLDKALLSISVYDNVGNFETKSISTHHFGELHIEDWAIEYNQKFLELDSEQYSSKGWNRILSLYSNLNLMFMSKETTLSNFDNATKDIDAAINAGIDYKYTIKTVPQGISTNISYEINTQDILNFKKADNITLVLNALEESAATTDKIDIANNLAGYDKSLSKPFHLSFRHNEVEIDYDFVSGVTIVMALPRGYEERYFSIINLDTQTIIESTKINNTIIFSIKGKGEFALVIEGEEKTNKVTKVSGLKVFGKTISWLSFSLTILGIISCSVLLIVYITYRFRPKRPKMPKRKKVKKTKDTKSD